MFFPSSRLSKGDSTSHQVNSRLKFWVSCSLSILGIKGGLSYFLVRRDQSMVANQGWFLMSTMLLIRTSGSLAKSRPKRLRTFLLQLLLKYGSSFLILSQSCARFLQQKGGIPWISSQMSDPKHQQSTALPWPSFLMISGARYSGVPQTENKSRSPKILLQERPKSVSLMYPCASINMFQGLRLYQVVLTPDK